jgi:hypothetical protein
MTYLVTLVLFQSNSSYLGSMTVESLNGSVTGVVSLSGTTTLSGTYSGLTSTDQPTLSTQQPVLKNSYAISAVITPIDGGGLSISIGSPDSAISSAGFTSPTVLTTTDSKISSSPQLPTYAYSLSQSLTYTSNIPSSTQASIQALIAAATALFYSAATKTKDAGMDVAYKADWTTKSEAIIEDSKDTYSPTEDYSEAELSGYSNEDHDMATVILSSDTEEQSKYAGQKLVASHQEPDPTPGYTSIVPQSLQTQPVSPRRTTAKQQGQAVPPTDSNSTKSFINDLIGLIPVVLSGGINALVGLAINDAKAALNTLISNYIGSLKSTLLSAIASWPESRSISNLLNIVLSVVNSNLRTAGTLVNNSYPTLNTYYSQQSKSQVALLSTQLSAAINTQFPPATNQTRPTPATVVVNGLEVGASTSSLAMRPATTAASLPAGMTSTEVTTYVVGGLSQLSASSLSSSALNTSLSTVGQTLSTTLKSNDPSTQQLNYVDLIARLVSSQNLQVDLDGLASSETAHTSKSYDATALPAISYADIISNPTKYLTVSRWGSLLQLVGATVSNLSQPTLKELALASLQTVNTVVGAQIVYEAIAQGTMTLDSVYRMLVSPLTKELNNIASLLSINVIVNSTSSTVFATLLEDPSTNTYSAAFSLQAVKTVVTEYPPGNLSIQDYLDKLSRNELSTAEETELSIWYTQWDNFSRLNYNTYFTEDNLPPATSEPWASLRPTALLLGTVSIDIKELAVVQKAINSFLRPVGVIGASQMVLVIGLSVVVDLINTGRPYLSLLKSTMETTALYMGKQLPQLKDIYTELSVNVYSPNRILYLLSATSKLYRGLASQTAVELLTILSTTGKELG